MVGQHPVKMQIWDTSGQERFETVTSAYYRGAHAVVLTYDITNRNSFDLIRSKFYEKAISNCSPNASISIVGNKSDLEGDRKVEFAEGESLA